MTTNGMKFKKKKRDNYNINGVRSGIERFNMQTPGGRASCRVFKGGGMFYDWMGYLNKKLSLWSKQAHITNQKNV